jgi:hypothetical protein
MFSEETYQDWKASTISMTMSVLLRVAWMRYIQQKESEMKVRLRENSMQPTSPWPPSVI